MATDRINEVVMGEGEDEALLAGVVEDEHVDPDEMSQSETPEFRSEHVEEDKSKLSSEARGESRERERIRKRRRSSSHEVRHPSLETNSLKFP